MVKTREETFNGLAVFSSAYLKRWLEGHFYDKAFQTKFGEKLKTLGKEGKYAIEFGLNLLTAFFDQKLSEDNFLQRLVKEVGLDAGPEISKRLINNTKDHLNSVAITPEEKDLVSILLQLEGEILMGLLNCLYDLEATERTQILKQIARLSPEELHKLAELQPKDMRRFIGLFSTQPKATEHSFLSQETIKKIEAATAKIEDVRKKRREKGKG